MIPSWIDSVVVGVLVTIIIYLVYRFFKTRTLFKALSELYMQELADRMLLQKKVEELYQDIENAKLEQTDGFLKFVSESRDWAFQYIEEVQAALSEFDKDVTPTIEWANTFGQVLGETAHTNALKRISEAYDKLKEVLPKENQTPNN
jgi:hypothetical protein